MRLLSAMQLELAARMFTHDRSKLESPELEMFEKHTDELRGLTYGSDEYNRQLALLKEDALPHHYAHNRHHPEHFPNGVDDMNLIDVLEMVCDWFCSSKRHADGDIYRSIDVNTERFDLSPQLAQIIRNTVPILTDPYEHLGGSQANIYAGEPENSG
jgi:hypothetical protein